jgi:Tat protein translocase TatB subunit
MMPGRCDSPGLHSGESYGARLREFCWAGGSTYTLHDMLSIPHLLIIFLVALIVLGPDKLPQVARMLGKTMAEFRRITGDFRTTIEGEVREMERQAEIRQAAAAAQAEVAEAVGSVARNVSQTGVDPAAQSPASPASGADPHAPVSAETEEPVPANAPGSAEKLTNGQSHSS